jgi:hypothetical protein
MERLSRLTVFPHPLQSTLTAVTSPAQTSRSISAFLSLSSIMFRFPARLFLYAADGRTELRVFFWIGMRRGIIRFFLKSFAGA